MAQKLMKKAQAAMNFEIPQSAGIGQSVGQNGVGFTGVFIQLRKPQPADKSLIQNRNQEEAVTRISRTVRFIPQGLRDTLR